MQVDLIRYRIRESTPSTEVALMPFLTMNASNGVPRSMDCPTTRCCHATTLPLASSPALIAWKYIGR
jgi:hypothetical protein